MKRILLGIVALLVVLSAAPALAVIYNEGVSGDLSNNQLAPTPLTLSAGSNSITGTVGGSDNRDWVALTVPAGMKMTSYVNSSYAGTDLQGFTGFRFGSTFPGDPMSAGSYAGYSHFGLGATNGSGANGVNNGNALTTVGVDLFSAKYMPNNNASGGTAAGSTGFTPPLGPGTYTFLIQQDGTNISYQFTMNVVPEPSTICLAGMGALALLATARRKRGRA
ncbi:MAG TPA: PEP-CTERM sorting domain-containing protein [Pirellulales bacterium]|nr:PEP-CTERM sorting domain-containing protein [Pirellulales bacterium]